VVVTLYVVLAKISFLLTIDLVNVTPIFLPTGFALASVLIFGRKPLIGIWFGSLYTNLFLNVDISHLDKAYVLTHFPLACFIATGHLIASNTAMVVVNRLCKKEFPLSNGKNILILLILAPIVYSTIISSIGVFSLKCFGAVAADQFWYTLKTWWLGDAVGIILFTPFILSWTLKGTFNKNNVKTLELSVYVMSTILLCFFVFFHYPSLKYLIFPLLFWPAYRFGIQITTLLLVIISLFATLATVVGIGPFNEESINDSILFLDFFLCVISICSLFLTGIISEQERAEDSIKTGEKNLRNNQILFESTLESPRDVGIYSLGLNYEYLSFNTLHRLNMKVINGVDIELGMRLQDCVGDKVELEKFQAILDKVFLGENIAVIGYFSTDNSFWRFNTSPIYNQNNKIIGATVISTDITEIKKAEEALKKSEEKYRNIFENIQDVIFQTDPNGIFLSLSPSIKDFAGYTGEELIGKSMNILHADDAVDNDIIRDVNEKLVLKNFEKILKTKSGELIWVSLDAKMIFDENGNKHHIDAFARDITQRKQNQKKIAYQNKRLQIQNKELEQFAYIASHDLQEPLITLKYFSELLKAESPNNTADNTNQYLDFIMQSTDRMQKLVKGLLDYTRIGIEIELTEVDCNEIVQEAISSLSEIIQKSDCQIATNNLPKIRGSYEKLILLFQNLIENAIKFKKENTSLSVDIAAEQVGDSWEFTVKDNGIGIEEHNKEKAFVIFKRLNNRDEYAGIGIGLALCKKIIVLHGGDIWVESIFGEGTTIHFTLVNIQKKQKRKFRLK
jgi:PAS domain S-box-containing protein